MNHLSSFLNQWGDAESIKKVRISDKGIGYQMAESENHLKDMAMRFERSPNQNTLKLWASDIIEAGYQDWMVKEVCKSIPFKFEKHPTLNQIMELLRPYIPQANVLEDELTKYTHPCYERLKEDFIKVSGVEIFDKMVEFYAKNEPELKDFGVKYLEICMLGDWLRSYQRDGTAIMNQRLKTLEAIKAKDREYFIRPYKNYATKHGLVVK